MEAYQHWKLFGEQNVPEEEYVFGKLYLVFLERDLTDI